ncbi:major capsid protein [Capybara microvirus Cap3_SP_612]|nr:major capsid protein [Capybara microvirus Cap3_SP_612]
MSIFSKISVSKPKTSNFNLSEEVKLSCNFGQLIPILCKETLPGDKFKISTELLIKLAPLKAPVMHRLKAYIHYFYVPYYQINKGFEKFINPKVNEGSLCMPYLNSNDNILPSGVFGIASLADYLGLPITQEPFTGGDKSVDFNIAPFVAYQHIYNSYYRDQNLELLPDEGGNIETTTLFDVKHYENLMGHSMAFTPYPKQVENLFTLRNRAWKKDYFTSALPSPQAGADVLIPMSFAADVQFNHLRSNLDSAAHTVYAQGTQGQNDVTLFSTTNGIENEVVATANGANTTATINDFRRAMALQRFKELAERGGTRMPEFVRNFFNVHVPDYMVDRPIYLGGQSTPISIGEVVQTSQTTLGSEGSAQGTRAGVGNAYGRVNGITLKCPLHGYIMGILSIRPEATYSQGIERMWTRKSVYDYAWPQFANIGEQEIYNKEIFCTGTDTDNQVFGYTPRYAEYKEGHCHVAGEFRPGQSLEYWHFGRKFDNQPNLNKEFVMMEQMNYEPFNVIDNEQEHVYVNLYNNITARRPLPYFGTPSII